MTKAEKQQDTSGDCRVTFPCCPFLHGSVACCGGMYHPMARDWTSSHTGSLPVKAVSVLVISLPPGFSGSEHKSSECRFVVWEPLDEWILGKNTAISLLLAAQILKIKESFQRKNILITECQIIFCI